MADDTGSIMGMMMAVFGIAIMASVISGVVPVAATPPEVTQYACPLEPTLLFDTYDEMYAHFVTAHPTTDIDIFWD